MSNSEKRIVEFVRRPDGLFLDYADQFSAVAVNMKTGDVLLDEGGGSDRYNGVAVQGVSLPQFEAVSLTNGDAGIELIVQGDSYQLGVSSAPLDAITWVGDANAVVEFRALKRLRKFPNIHGLENEMSQGEIASSNVDWIQRMRSTTPELADRRTMILGESLDPEGCGVQWTDSHLKRVGQQAWLESQLEQMRNQESGALPSYFSVAVSVPLRLTGESPSDSVGTVLKRHLHFIEMACTDDEIPESLAIDISDIRVGGRIKVSQLTGIPRGAVVLTPSDATIVSLDRS